MPRGPQAHAEKLASAVTQATRPLLRQLQQAQAQQTAMVQSNAVAESALRAKLATVEAAAEASAGRLREANAALNAAREREAALGLQIEAAEEDKVELQRVATAASDVASKRLAGVRADLTQMTVALEEARATAHAASVRESAAIARVRELETQLSVATDTAVAQAEAHASELRTAREEAAAAASAAAAMAVARGAEGAYPSVSAHGGNGSLGGGQRVAALREMRESTARLQEGELVAVRKLLGTSERKQATLMEQLAAEREAHRRAMAETTALCSLRAEYAALNERHAAALEMLGEKEEERLMLQDALDALRAGR